MKSVQLILAALVIFLAGTATGSAVSGLRRKSRAKAELAKRELALSPMWYRMEFLRRVQRELELSPEQQSRLEIHIRASQERFRQLWEPVAPQVRTEFEDLRERIRTELTADQRDRFDKMLRDRVRRGDGRDRKSGEETNRTPRPTGPVPAN